MARLQWFPARAARRLPFVAQLALVASLLTVLAPGASAAPADFVFSGGGFGHGVGLSQYGAQGRALAGQSTADILGFYYEGTTVAPYASSPATVRVLLGDASSITVTPGAATTWQLDAASPAPLGANSALTVSAVGSQFSVNGAAPAGQASSVITVPIAANTPTAVSVSGGRYRWGTSITLRIVAPGTVRAVLNDVPMQQYLYGIAEMPASWRPEALRAQALAARTYAVNATLRRRADPTRTFDLYATVQDQNYAAYDFESSPGWDRWRQAVDDTNNQVILSGGQPIEAYYYSSNGGYTEAAEYVFAAPLAYIKAKPDPFDNTPGNGNFRWTRTFSATELQAKLRDARGTDIGPVSQVAWAGPYGTSGRVDRGTVTFTGAKGTLKLTGAQVRSALGLPSTMLFAYSNSPTGAVDVLAADRSGGVRVTGWAFDPNATAPLAVHVYVDNVFTVNVPAGGSRPDIGASFPGYGDNHGFDWLSGPLAEGTHSVCVYAINVGAGDNTLLRCGQVRVTNQPFGGLDLVSVAPGGQTTVAGWALDPNTDQPVQVHVYVDGVFVTAATAGGDRADIAAAFPGYGRAHGYAVPVALSPGQHSVCVYVINVGPGQNQLVSCRGANVVTGGPAGVVDSLSGRPGAAFDVAGWVIDPDTAAPVLVHVYVDGVLAGAGWADGDRADIAAVWPAYGPKHGFSLTLPAAGGTHSVCVFGINAAGSGANNLLGCRTLVVPTGPPVGVVDTAFSPAPGTMRVAGWAIDPDSAAPIDVHVYADGRVLGGVRADRDRPDVYGVFPVFGLQHGFDVTLPAPAGVQQVCVYGINVGAGVNSLIGCTRPR